MKPFIPILGVLFFLLSCFACDDNEYLSKSPVEEHKGIYINDFLNAGILGNLDKENSLLNWCKKEGFNEIYLYNVDDILLNSSRKIQLNAFVNKTQAHDWQINVSFVSSSLEFIDNISKYYTEFTKHPAGILSEIEFWNEKGSFTEFILWMTKLNAIKSKHADLIRRFYIGKIKDAEAVFKDMEVAKKIIENHDEILLVNYHTNAYNLSSSTEPDAIKTKLQMLANAASSLNKSVNILILFNVRKDSSSPNIYSYFDVDAGNHKFEEAYSSFYKGFETANITNKKFLTLKGFAIYRYSDAKAARP